MFKILLRVLFCANFALFHTLFPAMSDCVRFVRDFVLMSAFFVILLLFLRETGEKNSVKNQSSAKYLLPCPVVYCIFLYWTDMYSGFCMYTAKKHGVLLVLSSTKFCCY